MITMTRNLARSACLAALCLLVVPTIALAQQGTATVTKDAPIYVRAEVTTPLRVAAPGTRLRVLQDSGDWLQVEFGDPQYGRRVGWTQRQFVTLGGEAFTPMDLSVDPPVTPQAPSATHQSGAPVSREFGAAPRNETAVGWAFLHASHGLIDVDSTLGWNFSTSTNLAPWLGIAADVGGHYKTRLFGFEDVDVMEHTFMAGPRFAFREAPVAVPFAQFIVGMVRYDATNIIGDHVGSNNFAVQPGVGIDIGGPRQAARFEMGWRKVFGEVFEDGGSHNEFRVVVGFVIRSRN
jgi:hypothetical protein